MKTNKISTLLILALLLLTMILQIIYCQWVNLLTVISMFIVFCVIQYNISKQYKLLSEYKSELNKYHYILNSYHSILSDLDNCTYEYYRNVELYYKQINRRRKNRNRIQTFKDNAIMHRLRVDHRFNMIDKTRERVSNRFHNVNRIEDYIKYS